MIVKSARQRLMLAQFKRERLLTDSDRKENVMLEKYHRCKQEKMVMLIWLSH
jgi:hypothetical protein